MKPMVFKPKYKLSFWFYLLLFSVLFFSETLFVNKRYLQDSSQLPDDLVGLATYFALIVLLLIGKVKRLTIDTGITIDRLILKPLKLEFNDLLYWNEKVLAFQSCNVEIGYLSNSKSLMKKMDKLAVEKSIVNKEVSEECDELTLKDRLLVGLCILGILFFMLLPMAFSALNISFIGPNTDSLIILLVPSAIVYLCLKARVKKILKSSGQI
jgi:hypothetical protein